jgi:phytanoyl-CoA dioxygenase PhyH
LQVSLKTYARDRMQRYRERLSRPIRIARAYKEYTTRRGLAAGVNLSDCYDVSALTEQGYLPVVPPSPVLTELVSEGQRKLADTQTLPQYRNKPFFSQLLSGKELDLSSVFLRFALEEKMLKTVARYFGVAPFLESVDLLYSKPLAGPPAASQQWHKDRTDRRIIKVFVYINDVTPRNGPLSLLPRQQSSKVPEYLYHYVSDETMARHVPLSKTVALTGTAGTTIMVDSETCYHLGSRCEEPRLAYISYYTSGFGYRHRETNWQLPSTAVSTLSPLQRFALGLS